MSTQNPTPPATAVNQATSNFNVTLPYEDQIRIKNMFASYLQEEEHKPRTMLELNSIITQLCSRVAQELRDLQEIEKRITDYKKLFDLKDLCKRDYLIICNKGIMPGSPEALAKAEELYKKYVSTRARATARKIADSKSKKIEIVEDVNG